MQFPPKPVVTPEAKVSSDHWPAEMTTLLFVLFLWVIVDGLLSTKFRSHLNIFLLLNVFSSSYPLLFLSSHNKYLLSAYHAVDGGEGTVNI